jgi:hypothetical protein
MIERERRKVLAEKLAAATKRRALVEERRRWKAMKKALGTWVVVSSWCSTDNVNLAFSFTLSSLLRLALRLPVAFPGLTCTKIEPTSDSTER